MHYSKHTFYTPVSNDSGEIILGNYLTGSLDILEKNEVDEFLRRKNSNDWNDYRNLPYMLERGYIFQDIDAEIKTQEVKRQHFQNEYRRTPAQLIFTPTYACNFSCEYCYQVDYANPASVLTREIVDRFFDYIEEKFSQESVKPYITLFGGEPLLGASSYKNAILYFLEKSRDQGYDVAIVTNGYELINYIPEFTSLKLRIKEIQVTLDGNQKVHDQRRPTKTGGGSFEQVVSGIELALQSGYSINLRAIVDKNNMNSLPDLAEFINKKGWLDLPARQFQTTIGRNYELHFCQAGTPLYERAEMWRDYVTLAKSKPILFKFHKPQFHGIRTIYETGELPEPIFDGCPAGKKEWAFDFNGNIYGCTASVGVEKYKLGSFITGEICDETQIEKWKNRDVFSIPECQKCDVSLSCGGGCGVIAANKEGKIHGPDCRPVKELVSIGIEYYNIK